MIKELFKIGLCTLVGAAVIESLDKDGEISSQIDKLVDDVKKLPEELIQEESDTEDDYANADKIEQAIENFKRAVNPVTRYVDQHLAMDIKTAKKVLQKGDHIYIVRSLYSHHGIYDGEGGVYHYSNTKTNDNGWLNDKDTMVSYTSLKWFVKGNTDESVNNKINVRHYKSDLKGDEVIERAKSRLGEQKYNLLINNCEHFAYWCRGYENFA